MVILFLSELSSFLRIQREDRITIDTTRNEKMVINFNISLYEISCHGALTSDSINHRCFFRHYGYFRSATNGCDVASG